MKIKPSIHFMLIIALVALSLVGFVAIIAAGELRGYTPDIFIAVRDAALFVPLLGLFIWLSRVQKCRGDLILLTATIALFTLGTVAQYRLFSDPEYGARHGNERSDAREAKMQAIRLRNIRTGYDDTKLQALFGTADRNHLPQPKATTITHVFSVAQVLTSEFTYMPLLGILAFAVAYSFLKRDDILLLIQRSSLMIGILTLIPFTFAVLFLARAGKIFGTTPWEPVKILFLFSFAGILADNYRNISRTKWGLPGRSFSVATDCDCNATRSSIFRIERFWPDAGLLRRVHPSVFHHRPTHAGNGIWQFDVIAVYPDILFRYRSSPSNQTQILSLVESLASTRARCRLVATISRRDSKGLSRCGDIKRRCLVRSIFATGARAIWNYPWAFLRNWLGAWLSRGSSCIGFRFYLRCYWRGTRVTWWNHTAGGFARADLCGNSHGD